MGEIGMPELLLILFVVFLLFGAKKIPDLARGLGQGIREFKNAIRGEIESGDTGKQLEEPKKLPNA